MNLATTPRVDVSSIGPVWCACAVCGKVTKHAVLNQSNVSGAEHLYDDEYVEWLNEFQIVQCGGCETVSFRRADSNSLDGPVQIGPNEWEDDVTETRYPSTNAGRQPTPGMDNVDAKLQRIYAETLFALNEFQPVLTGIGLRAVVETVCKDKSAVGGDLFSKINSLVTLGVLTVDGADLLHKIRSLGNNAAHEVKPHSSLELGVALDVVDNLLQSVYVIPYKARNTFQAPPVVVSLPPTSAPAATVPAVPLIPPAAIAPTIFAAGPATSLGP